jgi:hypothetical protein
MCSKKEWCHPRAGGTVLVLGEQTSISPKKPYPPPPGDHARLEHGLATTKLAAHKQAQLRSKIFHHRLTVDSFMRPTRKRRKVARIRASGTVAA